MLWLSGALLVLQLVSALPRVHYSGNAIARSQQEQTISPDAVTVTLASLLSVKAPLSVNSDVSRQVSKDVFDLNSASGAFMALFDHKQVGLQVEQLLEPDLFSRPSAVMSIAIAGSNIGKLRSLFCHSTCTQSMLAYDTCRPNK